MEFPLDLSQASIQKARKNFVSTVDLFNEFELELDILIGSKNHDEPMKLDLKKSAQKELPIGFGCDGGFVTGNNKKIAIDEAKLNAARQRFQFS